MRPPSSSLLLAGLEAVRDRGLEAVTSFLGTTLVVALASGLLSSTASRGTGLRRGTGTAAGTCSASTLATAPNGSFSSDAFDSEASSVALSFASPVLASAGSALVTSAESSLSCAGSTSSASPWAMGSAAADQISTWMATSCGAGSAGAGKGMTMGRMRASAAAWARPAPKAQTERLDLLSSIRGTEPALRFRRYAQLLDSN